MREVVLDTETTGFDPFTGDRLVEIGCLELINRMPTGQEYHVYINPERDMPESAFKVHGLSEEFLADKPKFAEVAEGFLEFIGASPLVIHNAAFDMKFLNAELSWLGRDELPMEQAIDTLLIARKKYPGAQNSLDALCRRFEIDASNRELHGALIDSYLLAEVYLELTGGRQPDLVLSTGGSANKVSSSSSDAAQTKSRMERPNPLPSRLSDEDLQAHRAFVEKELGADPVWGSTPQ
ncbi:MAG: DNA polymerase III subunit epsilon [Alphaproteobacteria bacterium]|nr:MAG: DNA polymerase III subunit epsilon [Alphaproteobacteria bacterium]